jgi:hypothetical protein
MRANHDDRPATRKICVDEKAMSGRPLEDAGREKPA